MVPPHQSLGLPSHLFSLSSSLIEPQIQVSPSPYEGCISCIPHRGSWLWPRGHDLASGTYGGHGEPVPGGEGMTFPSFPASCDGTRAAGSDRLVDDPMLGTAMRRQGLAANTPASSCPKPHLQNFTQKSASALCASLLRSPGGSPCCVPLPGCPYRLCPDTHGYYWAQGGGSPGTGAGA